MTPPPTRFSTEQTYPPFTPPPGGALTEQNRFLLTEEKTGELTARGQQIIDHTPMGRFGAPVDLVGAVLWLLSPAAAFMHGAVIPIDGSFAAYSGV